MRVSSTPPVGAGPVEPAPVNDREQLVQVSHRFAHSHGRAGVSDVTPGPSGLVSDGGVTNDPASDGHNRGASGLVNERSHHIEANARFAYRGRVTDDDVLALAGEFPTPSDADWMAAVGKILRGRSFDAVLRSGSYTVLAPTDEAMALTSDASPGAVEDRAALTRWLLAIFPPYERLAHCRRS